MPVISPFIAISIFMAMLSCSAEPKPFVEHHRNHESYIGIVSINTNGVGIDENPYDREWTDAGIALFDGDENDLVSLQNEPAWSGTGAIHIRGNSSAEYDKKQYALETRDAEGNDIDISPFGLPSEEDWILHAPFSDKTLMRNRLMFHWSNQIGRYAPRTRYVELYMEEDGGVVDERLPWSLSIHRKDKARLQSGSGRKNRGG